MEPISNLHNGTLIYLNLVRVATGSGEGEPVDVIETINGMELDPRSQPAQSRVTPVPGGLTHLQVKIMVC